MRGSGPSCAASANPSIAGQADTSPPSVRPALVVSRPTKREKARLTDESRLVLERKPVGTVYHFTIDGVATEVNMTPTLETITDEACACNGGASSRAGRRILTLSARA